jgi:hypothetical protein
MVYKQYSVVKLKELSRTFFGEDSMAGDSLPKLGDEAAILEVYVNPVIGYELECVSENGETSWLVTFAPEDAIFEVIYEST